jgi:hypothetical protein
MYLLNQGDLKQLSAQRRHLEICGFEIESIDVFSAVSTEAEKIQAIRSFYNLSVDGWWNYQDELIQYGICTQEEFLQKLREGRNL